jgi:hypothetical protein
LEKQFLQKQIQADFPTAAIAGISATDRPAAGRFDFGRSYSMQIPRFWYKPRSAFNRHILALFAVNTSQRFSAAYEWWAMFI